MSELSSTIRIEDGFTEPLKNLVSEAWKADNAVTALGKSITEMNEDFDFSSAALDSFRFAVGDIQKDLNHLTDRINIFSKQLIANTKTNIKSGLKIAGANFKSFTDTAKGHLNDLTLNAKIQLAYFQKTFPETMKKLGNTAFKKSMHGIGTLSWFGHNPREIPHALLGKAFNAQDYLFGNKRTGQANILNRASKRINDGINNNASINKLKTRLVNARSSYIDKTFSPELSDKLRNTYKLSDNQIAALATKQRFNRVKSAANRKLLQGKHMVNDVQTLAKATGGYGNLAKIGLKNLGKQIKTQSKKGFAWLNNTEGFKVVKGFAGAFAKEMGIQMIGHLATKVAKKLRDTAITFGKSLADCINNSLDEINLSDKFNAMWGKQGEVAKERAFSLAQELGENATMIGEMSAKAAYGGIGTDSFERIMKLADKVGTLSIGQTTESAANTLIDNIKSGHDAGSIAQMFGGGQMMEKQLRRAGYERALNRGDLDKALSIAEEIAEQAGLTDEKYKGATNNLSQNFQKVMNIIDNVKRRLAELFSQQLAPVVEKVKNFLESKTFKYGLLFAETIIKKIGALVNWVAEGIIDNLKIIAVLAGVGLVVKVYSLIRSTGYILSTVKLLKGPIMWILKATGIQGLLGNLTKAAAKALALKALKFVGIGAGITAALYGLYKLTGTSKSFVGWLKGVGAAAYQFMFNLFQNIFIWFSNIPENIQIIGLRIKQYFIAQLGFFKRGIGSLLEWVFDALVSLIEDSPLKPILEKLGVSTQSMKNAVHDWTSSFGKENLSDAFKIEKEIQAIDELKTTYVDLTDGMIEAYESEGAQIGNMLKKYLPNLEPLKAMMGIQDDTKKIRQQGESEEDLKWLKAYSDRQIMSRYGNTTSNTYNETINGVSQVSIAHRLNTLPHTRSGRARARVNG